MTFRLTRRGYFTINGVTPEAAAKGLIEAGAAVVGANCTLGPADMAGLVRAFRQATPAPLIFQPNAGSPRLLGGKEVYDQTAEEFASQSVPLRAAGADILGACCGSNPEFIRRLARRF